MICTHHELDVTEALSIEAQHFADCIQKGTTPITDGHAGLRVVSVLEAATRSVRAAGKIGSLWVPYQLPMQRLHKTGENIHECTFYGFEAAVCGDQE